MAGPREGVQNSKLEKFFKLGLGPSLYVGEILTVNQGFTYCREHVGKITIKVYVFLALAGVNKV
jgi:hypothetical protein